MTNELGQIVQYQAFTAFGEPIESLTQPAPPTPLRSRYGYAGAWGYQGLPQEQAATDSFPYLHVGARYYDPEIGRFLQRDPIGIAGGLNTYAYCQNNPVEVVDPSGLIGNADMKGFQTEYQQNFAKHGRGNIFDDLHTMFPGPGTLMPPSPAGVLAVVREVGNILREAPLRLVNAPWPWVRFWSGRVWGIASLGFLQGDNGPGIVYYIEGNGGWGVVPLSPPTGPVKTGPCD